MVTARLKKTALQIVDLCVRAGRPLFPNALSDGLSDIASAAGPDSSRSYRAVTNALFNRVLMYRTHDCRDMSWLDSAWINLASAVSALVGVGVLIVGVYIAHKELQHLRADLRESTYLEYSNRYNHVAEELPLDVFGESFNVKELDGNPKFQRLIKAYIDLCSEEVKLACRGMIPPNVWRDWEEEIRIAMNSPAGKWARDKFDFDREYKTLGLFLRGKEAGMSLAREEYGRPQM